MQQIGLDGVLVRGQLAGRGRRRPLPEIIKPPGAQVIGVGFLRVASRLGFRHVAVGDRAPGGAPFVGIAGLDATQRVAGVGRLDAQRRVGAGLRPCQRFGLDLVDGAVGGLRGYGPADETHGCGEPGSMQMRAWLFFFFWFPLRSIMSATGQAHKGPKRARSMLPPHRPVSSGATAARRQSRARR